MAEAVLTPVEPPRRFPLDWIPGILFYPRQTMAKITAQARGVWFTPLLILTLTGLLAVLAAGPLKIQETQMKGPTLPPDFQYYSPEQQAQVMQAFNATQTPVFIYVFPGLVAVAKVWMSWLVAAGLLHLMVTLLGGRGNTGSTLNLVAWASLPFAIRDIVRLLAMLSNKALIQNPGLAGFAPAGEGRLIVFLTALLSLIDLYAIWYFLLLIVGVRHSSGVSVGKALLATLITVILLLAASAGITFAGSLLGNLNVVRPFFF